MSSSRWFAPAIALAAVLAVVGVGSLVPSPSSASQQPAPVEEPLSGAVQVCPGSLESPETVAAVAAVSLGDDAAAGPSPAPGSAIELAPLDPPGEGAPDSPPAATESGSEPGVTVQAPAEVPVLVRASGSLAPGLLSESTLSAAGERTSGLASQPCLEPARDLWFAAGSGEVGRRATLLLANPSSSAVVVDVDLFNESGPLSSAGTSDLGIPAFGTRTLAVDALALGSERIGVHVRTEVGRVGGALLLREVDGADPIGLSMVTPSRPPALVSYVPGLPAFGERRLRLLNPGEEDAIATLRVVGGSGVFTPVGLEAIDVPAGQVVDVDLQAAGEEAFALEVDATGPVVSAVEIRQTPSSGLGDFAVIGSADTIEPAAGTLLSSADGRSSRLVLTALPEPSRAAGDEVGDDAGQTPDPTAGPTGAPSPTATPTPTQTPGAPDATASPEATASPTPTATPASTDEAGGDFIDVEVPTTQVVVRILGPEGDVVPADVVTLAIGTTEALTVELPDDVTQGWVVIEATDPDVVLAARETTTTVEVPDPLDPDVEREAFWLDVVALAPSPFTVAVPPVLPDIRAGS